MSVVELLKRVALFEGLSEHELEAVSTVCRERSFADGETLVRQGDTGDELFVIQDGQVEIRIVGILPERPIVVLGEGQILGEMSLLDQGFRSATARATAPTRVQAIGRHEFTALCEQSHHIGYLVMRNLAADLSFKIRHRNLATM